MSAGNTDIGEHTMQTTTEITTRIAELKQSVGTHEFAPVWIPAAIRELETALGWARHLEHIDTANPGQDTAERANAARWIADHVERGERIAREAGAHIPPAATTTADSETPAHPAAICWDSPAGTHRISLADRTLDGILRTIDMARRQAAKGNLRNLRIHAADGTPIPLHRIPQPTTDPAPYTVTYANRGGRRTETVPADRIRQASRLLMRRADLGHIWSIEAHRNGRDVTFDIPAFRA
ncbi:hypothetical protein ACFRCG_41725 [Embleya sp. NPDC056575]|uniref:hypothetical protein n=1 Tax=unclassified Embleya TaxID=2699296 RepID=UPI0036A45C5A